MVAIKSEGYFNHQGLYILYKYVSPLHFFSLNVAKKKIQGKVTLKIHEGENTKRVF